MMLHYISAVFLILAPVWGSDYYVRTESLFAEAGDDTPSFDPPSIAGSGSQFVFTEVCPAANEPIGAESCNANDVCSNCIGWVVNGIEVEQLDNEDDYPVPESSSCDTVPNGKGWWVEGGAGIPGFDVFKRWWFLDSENVIRASLTVLRTGVTAASATVQYASDVEDASGTNDAHWFQQDGTPVAPAADTAVTAGSACVFNGGDSADTVGVHAFGAGWTSAQMDGNTINVLFTTPVLQPGESATYVIYLGVAGSLAAGQTLCNRIRSNEATFLNCFQERSTTQNWSVADSAASEKSLLLLLLLLLLLIPLLCCCCLLLLCCLRRKKKGAGVAFATFDAQQMMPTACLPAPTYTAVPAACEFAPGPALFGTAAPVAGPAFGTCY